MITTLSQLILTFLHLPAKWTPVLAISISTIFVILLAIVLDEAARRLLGTFARLAAAKTKSTFDDLMVEKHVFDRAAHLVPLFVFYLAIEAMVGESSYQTIGLRLCLIGMLAVGLAVVTALINAIVAQMEAYDLSDRVPLVSYGQTLKILFAGLTVILMLSVALDKSPWIFLSSIGAMAAVLLFVFKDTLQAFVASFQIAANTLLKAGDWIEITKYGIDGEVIEVTLGTIRIQNWDNTYTSVPPSTIISEPFKNWRGMQESGGRRIKRAVCMDMTTVHFVSAEQIARYTQVWDGTPGVSNGDLPLTNLTLFRAYLIHYLKHHPRIRQDMTAVVRLLEPSEKGLPIEIYAFTSETALSDYEDVQADIFDHIVAKVPAFDLKVFQAPSGTDIRFAATNLR
jgi:miniconductance mechanosensitive channel